LIFFWWVFSCKVLQFCGIEGFSEWCHVRWDIRFSFAMTDKMKLSLFLSFFLSLLLSSPLYSNSHPHTTTKTREKRERERERERERYVWLEVCTWHCLFDVLPNMSDLIGWKENCSPVVKKRSVWCQF